MTTDQAVDIIDTMPDTYTLTQALTHLQETNAMEVNTSNRMMAIESKRRYREFFFATIHEHWDITDYQVALATRIQDWEILMMFVAGMDALNREGRAEKEAAE